MRIESMKNQPRKIILPAGDYFYLAHPFDSRYKVRKWELGIEERTGIVLLNPFYDAERRDIERIDLGRSERYKEDPNEIVERDLNAIKDSRGVVAIVDGSLSYGTIMEMAYAKAVFRKIVLSLITNGHAEHPWLKYHSSEIFKSFKALEKRLIEIQAGARCHT